MTIVFLAVTEWELPEVGARSRTAQTSASFVEDSEFTPESERRVVVDDPFPLEDPELVATQPVLDERPVEPVESESEPGLTFEDLWPSLPDTDLIADLEPDVAVPETDAAPPEASDAPAAGPASDPSDEVLAAVHLDNPPPSYPRASQRLGEEGEVLLRLEIAADGRVVAVTVLESSGHARLDRAAREAVARWRFAPARRAGVAVEWELEHRVVFRLGE